MGCPNCANPIHEGPCKRKNKPENQDVASSPSSVVEADSGASERERPNWAQLNRARGVLIDKGIAGTLGAHESVLLAQANAYTDLYLEQFERAEKAEAEVERLREACAQVALRSSYENNPWANENETGVAYPLEKAGYDMATRAIAAAIRSRITAHTASTPATTEALDPPEKIEVDPALELDTTELKTRRTPGPWAAYDRGIGWEIVVPDLQHGTRRLNDGHRDTFTEADARFIASAWELEAENARLRAVLAVYADTRHWKRSRLNGPIDEWISLEDDEWNGPDLARAALERKP
jgi:hypothetical protein